MSLSVGKPRPFWFYICGFNITILAALAGIAAYTLLVGADAAVVRAALMRGLALFARQLGRRQEGLNSLAFVADQWL